MTRCAAVTALMCLIGMPAYAQWLNYPTPGMPRTVDGKPDLTAAAPRTPDGQPDLSGTWRMTSGKYRLNIAADLTRDEVLPWAQAASRRRLENLREDNGDPCQPPGPRITYNAVLFKIVQTSALTIVLYEVNNDYFRQIFTDGRALPRDPNPSWFGYSVGRWDDETFVVETIGFNGKAALDAFGHPHTEALRTTERYRRRDFGHIDLEITYDDPKAYTRPFTVRQTLQFQPDNELLEAVCHENERDRARLIGRTTPPVKVAPEILARYAGTYEIGPGRLLVFTVVDDQLWVEPGGSGPVPLHADSDTTFMLELAALGPASRFDFFSDTKGRVTHLTWQRPTGDVKAVRIGAAPSLTMPQGKWVAPRTPWGDPDLQGVFTNEDQQRVPMERPDRFAGRTLGSITAKELAEFARESNEAARGREHPFGGLDPLRFDLKPGRAWLVVDPPDGKIPPLTALGEQRQAAFRARLDRVPTAAEDSNLWYRCISIGVPRSMMPLPDGSPFRIVQSPGYVAIQYEIMHEARVIPLDRRSHAGSNVKMYMGDARGHWDGNTLVVETTNFKGAFQMTSPAGTGLRIVERFTPQPSGSLEWSVTIDDSSGWTRPWTFSMPLTRGDESQGPLENACHEGNYVLGNILSAARAEEKAAEDQALRTTHVVMQR